MLVNRDAGMDRALFKIHLGLWLHLDLIKGFEKSLANLIKFEFRLNESFNIDGYRIEICLSIHYF